MMKEPFLSETGMSRRDMLRGGLAAGIAGLAGRPAMAQPGVTAAQEDAPVLRERPAANERRFRSEAIENVIAATKAKIADPTLATMFENCFPNTLDTTVFPGTYEGKPDTFVITGDINAMWLRDSSAQLWPYLPYCKDDSKLAQLVEGAIRRQSRCITLDPYANAFLREPGDKPLSWSVHDDTDMKAGVGERKWEIDSLCYTLRLAHGYWKATGSTAPFDAQWKQSAELIVETFRVQQRKDGPGPYHFQRPSQIPTDTLMLSGYGNPAVPVGMIFSMFRPSDDACIYPLFVPANLFAVTSLGQLAEIADAVYHDAELAQKCHALAAEVSAAVAQHGKVHHAKYGEMLAYEVDGYGGTALMDDANAPGILSLAYLGCMDVRDPLYQRSRRFVLSTDNPYFFKGTAGEGIGGPHEGLNSIWPMSIMFRAFTSTDDAEKRQCLRWLRNTTAGTNFIHETFQKDDAAKYTRPWFAWANGLFGELILHIEKTSLGLLRESYA
jgi:meiotically up-regulated gene 157 (Mug157) protein